MYQSWICFLVPLPSKALDNLAVVAVVKPEVNPTSILTLKPLSLSSAWNSGLSNPIRAILSASATSAMEVISAKIIASVPAE